MTVSTPVPRVLEASKFTIRPIESINIKKNLYIDSFNVNKKRGTQFLSFLDVVLVLITATGYLLICLPLVTSSSF